MASEPRFFAAPSEFRAWLEAHHALETELFVGFHKRGSGLPSMTWPEAVDAALCFGWIDGVRKSIDETSYQIRFTPRKASSKWSSVNTKRVAELTVLGHMHEAGLKAFAARVAAKSGVYAYEQRHSIELDASQRKEFQRNKQAWEYFEAQANWYRKTALWWVVSAKQEATRVKRLSELIASSEQGRPIRQLTRPVGKKKSAETGG